MLNIVAIAQAAAQILTAITGDIQTGKTVLSTDQLADLKAILDPLHASNMAASAVLDAQLAEAEQR